MPTPEQRLQLIEDRFAILDLEARYAEAWDLGEPADWAAVFTPDGIFEMLSVGHTPATRIAGSEALTGFCAHIRQEWSGLHFMHPPRLTLKGDEAESVIFFEFRHVMKAGAAHTRQGVTGGHYHTRYVRTAAGWRMQHRVEKAVFENLATYYAN